MNVNRLGAVILFSMIAACDDARELVGVDPADSPRHDLVETSTELQITSNPFDQILPAVSGHRIVWQDRRSGNWDVYLYDTRNGEVRPIANTAADEVLPDIDGERVVWHELTDDVFPTLPSVRYSYLNVRNLTTGMTARIATTTYDPGHVRNQAASISAHRVAWTQHEVGGTRNPNVRVHNLLTGITTRISASSASQHWASISGGRVVWGDARFHATHPGAALLSLDLDTGVESLLVKGRHAQYPHVDGERVVWQEYHPDLGGTLIHLLELSTSVEQVLAGSASNPAFLPVVWNDWVVWQQHQTGGLQLHNLRTRETRRLVSNPSRQQQADIADGHVVWQDNRNGNWDIYTLSLQMDVALDIKPHSDPNSINSRSRGTIPVAILSSQEFDAPSRVERASLTFGRTGDEASLHYRAGRPNCGVEDVNADGRADLVCHFETEETGFAPGDTEGILGARTIEQVPIEGRDAVRIVR